MYDFITHTWNTIKGACSHDCSYCYMKRWGKLNPVRFDKGELNVDHGSGNFIFVGSSNDMFVKNIHYNWIADTLNRCIDFEGDNKYMFQSKNPARMIRFAYPEKSTLGTTIESDHYDSLTSLAPWPPQRARAVAKIKGPKFVTIEPIMDFDLTKFVELLKIAEPDFVNIGADSGGNKLPEPTWTQVEDLIAELKKFTEVRQKRNLGRLKKKL